VGTVFGASQQRSKNHCGGQSRCAGIPNNEQEVLYV
jgi:hypothetical protein